MLDDISCPIPRPPPGLAQSAGLLDVLDLASPVSISARPVSSECGLISNGNGPNDYRNVNARLGFVETQFDYSTARMLSATALNSPRIEPKNRRIAANRWAEPTLGSR